MKTNKGDMPLYAQPSTAVDAAIAMKEIIRHRVQGKSEAEKDKRRLKDIQRVFERDSEEF